MRAAQSRLQTGALSCGAGFAPETVDEEAKQRRASAGGAGCPLRRAVYINSLGLNNLTLEITA
ncbi:MAG: hypothetical protein E7422_07265 [Ruminococcaceae bacterium]|nr:hypothetical protein [Oscillospiraceae bacterium]